MRPPLGLTSLTVQETTALNELLDACAEVDGALPFLQRDKALNRNKEMKHWFLLWDGAMLVGVLSLFAPVPEEAEVTACVLPERRNQQCFTALWRVAETELRQWGVSRVFFITRQAVQTGHAVLEHWGIPQVRTEYAMAYGGGPVPWEGEGSLCFRHCGEADAPALAAISAEAFHEPVDASLEIMLNTLKTSNRELFGAFLDSEPVATASLRIEPGRATIHGLAVREGYRGKGLGRRFVLQLLEEILGRGLMPLLDVDSENPVAFSLYQSLGFTVTDAQDYYRLNL